MKNKICVVMTCVCAMLATAARADLVAYYSFEDGTAVDGSGNNNNGVINGTGITAVNDAQRGAVLNFPGSSGNYIRVENSPTLNAVRDSITIAMWLYTGSTSNRQLIEKGGTSGSAWYTTPWGIRMESDRRLRLNWGNTATLYATAFPLNTWTHVAMTYDYALSSNQAKFYINGVLNSQANWTTRPSTNTNALFIGADAYNYPGTQPRWLYLGRMDDVAIFNTALSGSEIVDVMNGLIGRQKIAQKPDPANGAGNVPPYKVLSWEAPNDPSIAEVISYDVYLDPNSPKVTNRDPSTRKIAAQPGTSFDPTPDLAFSTTYYWSVDTWVTLANDPNTPKKQVLQPGKVWSFTVKTPAPEITAQPANALVSVGQPASFTVAVLSPHAPVSYQWYTSADGVNNTAADDKLIDGATSDTYTIPSVALTDETYYYCKTSNVYNSNPYTTSSNTAALGVKRQVAHWVLDALVDGKYPDSSGEGHNAQPGGTPVFADGVNPTLTGNGVVVDLTNGWAQAGAWDPSQYSGQLTISAWVKWNGQPATPAYQGLLGKRTTSITWQLEIANNAASLLSFKSSINGITGPILPVGEWIQVVITYDGTTATMYRNGTYSVSGPVTLGTDKNANLMIGAVGLDPAQAGPTSPFNGTMDDVRIYNYALDPVTVAYSFTDIKGGTVCADPRNPILVTYDLNGDCTIGLADMVDWASHWLGGQLVPDVISRP